MLASIAAKLTFSPAIPCCRCAGMLIMGLSDAVISIKKTLDG